MCLRFGSAVQLVNEKETVGWEKCKMAESKGSLLAKSVQKHAGRAKEKLLQNLGKVDRTADDIFDEHLQNFTIQQNNANRLQKEFNNYIRCIRAVQTASKSLMEAITEVYEPQWTGSDVVSHQSQSLEMLWQDFSHKLGDQVLIPLNTYQSQFPEMRKKIDKRGRKLVDYDSQRHSFQGLQASSGKKRDDVKVTRGREQLEEAKRTYELLNSELHDELPALFDSRVLFLVTNLQTLFASEQLFHAETSKVYAELEAIVDKLATDSQRGSYTMKKINSLPRTNNQGHSPLSIKQNNLNNSKPASPINNAPGTPSPPLSPASTTLTTTPTSPTSMSDSPPSSPLPAPHAQVNGNHGDVAHKSIPEQPSITTAPDSPPATPNNNKNVEQLYDIPVGATTADLPAGVLYRVKATYKYTREDVDELSFEVGDTIRVIEYEDPEEQEEGWLMGIKEGSTEKGMFPANFTRPM